MSVLLCTLTSFPYQVDVGTFCLGKYLLEKEKLVSKASIVNFEVFAICRFFFVFLKTLAQN